MPENNQTQQEIDRQRDLTKAKIADLNKLKLRLQDQEIKDKVETPLLKRIIRIDGGFNSTHLEVAICPICACLVERKGDLTYTIKGK